MLTLVNTKSLRDSNNGRLGGVNPPYHLERG
jgi:hypothetical protein